MVFVLAKSFIVFVVSVGCMEHVTFARADLLLAKTVNHQLGRGVLSSLHWRNKRASYEEVGEKIASIVRQEYPFRPLSDQGIVNHLGDEGIPVLVATVKLHRKVLSIPPFTQRKITAVENEIQYLIADEDPDNFISDRQIIFHLRRKGVSLTMSDVEKHRHRLGIPSDIERATGVDLATVLAKISEYVDKEDKRRPLSNNNLFILLRRGGIPLSVYYIEEFLLRLGIPPANERRGNVAKLQLSGDEIQERITEIIGNEDPSKPHTDKGIATLLEEEGIFLSKVTVRNNRIELGVPSSKERGNNRLIDDTAKKKIEDMVDGEDPANPLKDKDIVVALAKEGLQLSKSTVRKYRVQLGIPPPGRREGGYW